MKTFLVCTREGNVISVTSAKTFEDAYDLTIASNYGALLIELSDSIIKDIVDEQKTQEK